MHQSIVVVGSLNMDLVVHSPRHPEVGETIIGSVFNTFPGGKGANQAVAAARLGGAVKMVGLVGDDNFGQTLIQTAKQDGVDTTYVGRDPQSATGVALITVDDAGQNTIVVVSGANARLAPEHVLAAEPAFQGASVLLLQLESPLPAISQAIRLARKHGLQIVLNPAPARELERNFLASVDYLIPNRSELALLAGTDAMHAAIDLLLETGVANLIVTLGDEGLLLVENQRQVHIPGYKVDVVDTTAAGDAFVGAFAVALTEGLTAHQAAEWSNAAAALSVTRAGAQPSLPGRAELENFLSKVK